MFSIQTPSLEPGITTTDAPQRTTPAKVEFPDEILEACRLDEQKRAMRAKSVPDWESLGLRVCYDLQLELQQANSEYTGSGRIVLKNRTGEELADLVLRTYPNAKEIYGGQLQVAAARLNGVQVEPEIFLDDRTAVRIPLTDPLPVDGLAVLEIEFNGQTAQNFNTQANVYGVFNY
ncbi:MAG TPA: hypothetical protein VJ436_02620, partial [Anaerolineales bacterium]|nr:hypothetical protein [Anaerolineales bacterium]